MKEKEAKCGSCKPFTIFIGFLVVATQMLVLLNIRNYYLSNDGGSNGSSVAEKVSSEQKKDVKPLRLDMARFEIEVVKPHKDMRAKFPRHPDMVIQKLSKLLDKERNKTASLLKKVSDIKDNLGLNEKEGSHKGQAKEKSFLHRTRRRLNAIEELPLCPEQSPHLLGPLYVRQQGIPDLQAGSLSFQQHFGANLRSGGASRPDECLARTKLAVIVAYRDRAEHLQIFLHHMHPIFQRQLLDYRIFVVEQKAGEAFNRGALMNIGYVEALKVDDFDCFVFHDVDLVPEDDRNLYECPSSGPKHMSVAVNKWKYRLQYSNYIGGVTTLSTEKFKEINGFATKFYGWGGEDDDFNHRIRRHNFTVNRNPANLARFFMLKHGKATKNNNLDTLMKQSVQNELDSDGLTTLKYTLVTKQELPLYTWLLVDLPPAPTHKPKSIWSRLSKSINDGVSYAAGGIAMKVADQAIKFAAKRDEEEVEAEDTIY